MLNATRYFSSDNGFGKDTGTAVNLLKITIKILKKFNIQYFLIAGTLLGHVRHEGQFIPWDDDIDLIVDSTILKKLPLIYKKYKNSLTLYNRDDFLIKTCFKDKVLPITNPNHARFLLNKHDVYSWPFVDLFVYRITEEGKLNFFGRDWDYDSFFPVVKDIFMGLPDVSIPRDPHYFLKLNYGDDYMYVLRSNTYLHKYEIATTISMQTTLKDYIRGNI